MNNWATYTANKEEDVRTIKFLSIFAKSAAGSQIPYSFSFQNLKVPNISTASIIRIFW